MSDRLTSLDPEVEGLLRELAGGSSSSALLEVEPRRVFSDPLLDAPSRSAGTLGWTPVERHLLQAHRDELGLALQRAFAVEMFRNDSSRVLAAVERPAWARGDAATVRRRVKSLASARIPPDLPVPIADVLAALVSGDAGRRPTLSQLALSARLLVDSESTRLLAGIAENAEGRPTRALEIASPIARESLRQDVRSAAWTVVGLAQSSSENMGQAVAAYRAALQDEPSCFPSAASLLVCAAQAGDEIVARDAAGALEAIAPPGERVETEIHAYRTRVGLRPDRFPRNSSILRSLSGSIGPVSQTLLDGIFQD